MGSDAVPLNPAENRYSMHVVATKARKKAAGQNQARVGAVWRERTNQGCDWMPL